MKKFFKMFGAAGLLAGMLILGGCGDDAAAPTTTTKSTTIPTTSVAAAPVGSPTGSIATTAAVPATSSTSVSINGVATTLTGGVTINSGVTIVPPAGSTFTTATPPVIQVTQPLNGTTIDNTTAIVGGISFVVDDAAGSVDISIQGVNSFTLQGGTGATVTIPVVKTPTLGAGNTTEVVFVKTDGTSGTLSGTYAATTGTTGPGVVTVTNVTNFCRFMVNPHFRRVSGNTGATGGSASVIGIK